MTETELLADAKWLAKEWEALVVTTHYPSHKLAFRFLYSLVIAYGRGKGLRLGNKRGFDKNIVTVSNIFRLVIKTIEETEHAEIWYPKLVSMGLHNEKNILKVMALDVPHK